MELGEYGNKYYMYDMSDATGFGIDIYGKKYEISKNGGIYGMAKIADHQYAYADGAMNVYVADMSNGTVKNKNQVKIKDIYYLWNINSNGKRKSTLMAGSNGTYVLNNDLTTKKLTGVEWQTFYLVDDMDGYLYANAGDEEKLYYLSGDTKSNNVLSEGRIDVILHVKEVK